MNNCLKCSSNSARIEFTFHSPDQAGLETGGWRAEGFKPEELDTHTAPADTKGGSPSDVTPSPHTPQLCL